MRTLHISVVDKIATYRQRDGDIVCGNSDYQIQFTFDSEWDNHTEKTARFIWGGQYRDVDFTGDICPVPALRNTEVVEVGVYAGDLHTTTSATIIPAKLSILCDGVPPSVENDKSYANEAKIAADKAEKAAAEVDEKLQEIGESIGMNLWFEVIEEK